MNHCICSHIFYNLPCSSEYLKVMKDCKLVFFLFVSSMNFILLSAQGPVICIDATWSLYEESCYKMFDTLKTWHNAEDHCKTFGGHLVSIESAAENTFVHSLLTISIKLYWIGLSTTDSVQTTTSDWKWSDGTVFSYANWDRFEDGGCVDIRRGSGKMISYACTYEDPFLCEVSHKAVTCPALSFNDPQVNIIDCDSSIDASVTTTCRFECNVGYGLQGDEERTCQSDGKWSGTDGQWCKVVTCTALSFGGSNGKITGCTTDIDPEYSAVCKFECDVGYELQDDEERTCQEDGQWSGTDGQWCKVVTCTTLSFGGSNGKITGCTIDIDPEYSAVCKFECDVGYELQGDEERTCQDDGEWSGTDGQWCKVVTCSALSFGDSNGKITGCITDIDLEFSTVCRFECYMGYELQGEEERTCQENGFWSGTGGQSCKIISCSELSFEGTIECAPENSLDFRTACFFTCPVGEFVVSGNQLRNCQADGQWSGIAPVCGTITCQALTFPDGSVVCDPPDAIDYNTKCSFICPSGYEPDVSGLTMTCELDKNWSGSMPSSCLPVDCGPYPNIENGDSVCDGTTYQKTCSVTCNLGYKEKNSQSQCMADGQWSDPPLECSRILCPDRDFSNQPGSINCNPPGFGYPSTCRFTCVDGYRLKGRETLTCQEDGMWNDIQPTCLDVYCQRLSLGDGTVSCPGGLGYASKCTFKCNFPMTLYGEQETTCLANEQWSSPVPECKLFDPKCEDAIAPTTCVDNCETNVDCEESEVCCQSSCGLTCNKVKVDKKKPFLNLDKKTALLLILANSKRRPRPPPPPVCPVCNINACVRAVCPTYLNAICKTSCNGCREHFFNPYNLRYDIVRQCKCPPNIPPNPHCGGYMCNGVRCANSLQAQCRVYGCGPMCYLQFFDRFGRRVPCKQKATCQPGINSIGLCPRGCLGASCPKYPEAHCRVLCPGCSAQFYDQRTNLAIVDCIEI
ncbi:P-selectin-like isoform X1 [Styela clava]